jgi:hypothetical protein
LFVVLLVMAPSSQELEPPANPGRFMPLNTNLPRSRFGPGRAPSSTIRPLNSQIESMILARQF